MICDYCKQEYQGNENEIILDGTEDFYVLSVCDKCYEKLSDYYTPEQIDEIIKS